MTEDRDIGCCLILNQTTSPFTSVLSTLTGRGSPGFQEGLSPWRCQGPDQLIITIQSHKNLGVFISFPTPSYLSSCSCEKGVCVFLFSLSLPSPCFPTKSSLQDAGKNGSKICIIYEQPRPLIMIWIDCVRDAFSDVQKVNGKGGWVEKSILNTTSPPKIFKKFPAKGGGGVRNGIRGISILERALPAHCNIP